MTTIIPQGEREPIYDVGQAIEFGTSATAALVHDAIMNYDIEWDPQKLRDIARSSLFMAQGEACANMPPTDRDAHQHVVTRIWYAVQHELKSAAR